MSVIQYGRTGNQDYKFEFKVMMQRYEHRTIEQELITARAQLASDYQSIQQINTQQLTSQASAQLLLNMINKLSSPTIGTQILKTDLLQLQYPFFAQYQIIMDKAEIYYYQSIIQDLTRIRNSQALVSVSKEEIRQCVEELNWKINVEKSSMVKQSQEVGENMDLMKFFQGVRNYQNWNQNIKRQTFARLKERAHSIQNQLSFKKGFILSKIEKQVDLIRTNHLGEIFTINRRYTRLQKIMQGLNKFRHNRIKGYFGLLLSKSKETSAFQHFQRIFTKYLPRKVTAEIRKVAIQVKAKKDQLRRLINKLANIKKRVETLYKFTALSKLNIKPMIKASRYTSAVKLVSHVCKKYYAKKIIKISNIPTKSIFNILFYAYSKQKKQCFEQLKKNDLEARLQRPNVSYKLKGMVLASLNKYQQQPINLKKTFSKWYLNTHQEKYAKKVYNIWLQGQTNKFTFFMRLKNLAQHMSKSQASRQMKNFVKVLCDKFHKYEQHSKKYMLTRWIHNNRRLRKIQGMFKLLSLVTNQSQEHFKKLGLEKAFAYCKRKQIVKQYCNQYMLQYIQNIRMALHKWTQISNLKKQWGKKKLRLILLQNTQKITNYNRQIISALKQNLMEGRQIKKRHTGKAINKDLIFLERFMQIWQRNAKNSIIQTNLAAKQTSKGKQKSILQIQSATKRVQTYFARDIIKKFISNRLVRLRRQSNLKNSFIKLIEANERTLKKQVTGILIQNLKEGSMKKEKLVHKLVHANVIKQKLGLLILRNKCFEVTQLLKRQRSLNIFQLLQNKVKQNYLIFNKKLHVAAVLQKIVHSYTSNVHLALKNWKAIPLRMRWSLRKKVVTLQQRLHQMHNQRLLLFQQQLKESLLEGKLKQRKGVYIMACQFQMVLKRYFNRYHTNTAIIKEDDKVIKVSKLFQAISVKSNNNFKPVFQSPPIWPKKAHHFMKLNETIKKRLQDYFLCWHKNSNALKYFGQIKDEKKKRNLQILSKIFYQVQARKTKTIVEKFQKNYRKRKVKNHILSKMCDSQVMKILKGFEVWRNLPVPTNKQTVQKAAKFQSSLVHLVKRNLKITVSAMKKCSIAGGEKKLQLARKFVFGVLSRVHTLFNIWRENKNIRKTLDKQNNVENIFQRMTTSSKGFFQLLLFGNQAQRKKNGLGIIEGYWKKQYQQYIKRWQKNTLNLKMKDLSKRHLLVALANIKEKHQNKVLVDKIVKMSKNRLEKANEKKKVRQMHIGKMIQSYQAHKRLLLNVTVDKLKFQHIKGNFHKNRAFSKFLREKITQINKMLQIWNNLASQHKQRDKNKIVATNFDYFEEALKKNFYLIFGRTKETGMKKNIIDRIFQAVESKYKDSFSIWKQKVKEYKILGELDKQTKATILQRINKIVQSTSTQAVITAIKKFNLNFKVQRLQKKFIEKLLQTKSGSVITAFNQWKAIPLGNMMGKYKNYQKFYFKMQSFFKNRLKFAHKVFSQTSQDATLMKKQSILKLFEMTSLGIRRYYNRWTRLTKEKHILMTVNWALKAFQAGQSAIIKQSRIYFKDQKGYRMKVATISKLVNAITKKTHNYIQLWKLNAQILNNQKKKAEQVKRKALLTISRTMATSQQGNILKVVSLFQMNSKVVKIAKSFFNRLMGTKTGKILGFFQKLKTIPDAKMNKLKKKAIIFESRLNSFSLKRLRDVLAPFKQSTYTASSKMKYCLDRLARACMGDNKKKFLSWRNINRQSKILNHTSLFEKLFTQMENSYRNNYDLVIKDAGSEVQKKKGLCRKLLNNSLFVQHHAYMIWKEAYHIDDINTKKRQSHYTNHLKNLISVFNNNENKKVIQVIGIFRKLLQLRNFQEYDFYKNYKNKRCVNFYSNLLQMRSNGLALFINALKANRAEFTLTQKSQKLLTIFQMMHNVSKENMNNLIETKQKTKMLNKMFTQLNSNTMSNIGRLFNIWRSNKKVKSIEIKVKNEKKRRALKTLNTLLIEKKKAMKLQVIQRFNLNLKASLIIKNFLIKIIKTKTGKHSNAFNMWKNLPYQQAKKLKNKATKFERGLLNILKGHLKQANDCFKSSLHEGISKKEEAARRIVRSKLLQTNRLFFRWRKVNNQNKITQKIVSLDKTFTHIQKVFNQNLTIFEERKMQDQRKIRATNNLFNNNIKKLNGFFNIWRGKTKTLKLYQFERLMRTFNPEDFNKRLMRIGFLMIQKRQQMQVLKGYINSLWKWKLSNIQASYYTKFINVFKESEELIKMYNVINKKLYENIHHSFRNILSIGHSRTNRKRQIVQKYLTRKARNYFLIFKNNTLKSEINIWKSKYTESIKAKIVGDVLTSIFLKPKYTAFNTINHYHNFTHKIDNLETVINNCEKNKVKQAYKKIKYSGQVTLLSISDRIVKGLRQYNIKQAFAALYENRRANRLGEVLSKIVKKHSYSLGFTKINRRKERIIKSRLSIILLSTLIGQQISEGIKLSINKFKKNRSKRVGAERINRFISQKYEAYSRRLFQECRNIQNITRLLQRFKRGQKLQKILEKQDEMLKKSYLNKMRKKENKWMELAIKKFATRASIRSSPAIALWRLKTFALNT